MAAALKQEPLQLHGEHLILYDGVCSLCNRLNRFVLSHDQCALFDFAPLQWAAGQSFLRYFGKDSDDLDTFYLVTNYRSASPTLLSKSPAAIAVLKEMDLPWRWLAVLKVLPRALLDWGYDVIARHRYRIFGRSANCLLPAPEYLPRFIDHEPRRDRLPNNSSAKILRSEPKEDESFSGRRLTP